MSAIGNEWERPELNDFDRDLEKQHEKQNLAATHQEVAEMQAFLKKEDCKIIDQLHSKYGDLVDNRRWQMAREKTMNFETNREFQDKFQESYPKADIPKDLEILGYVDGDRPIINMEHKQLLNTMIHERIHQLSHPLFREVMGNSFNEGTTEYLATKHAGEMPIADWGKCYPQEVRAANILAATVGDRAIEQAYFQGDFRQIAAQMDGQYGRGTFEQFRNLIHTNNITDATRLILPRSWPPL